MVLRNHDHSNKQINKIKSFVQCMMSLATFSKKLNKMRTEKNTDQGRVTEIDKSVTKVIVKNKISKSELS